MKIKVIERFGRFWIAGTNPAGVVSFWDNRRKEWTGVYTCTRFASRKQAEIAAYTLQTATIPKGMTFLMSIEWDGSVTTSHMPATQFIPALLCRPPFTSFEYAE